MYNRNFEQAPEHIVNNGKAAFGTYSGVSPIIDIRGMRAPYAGIPLPSLLSRVRIKSTLNYVFSLEDYIGMTEFYDFKAFGLGQLIFWNKQTGVKYVYHTFMANPRRFVPNNTSKARCASYNKNRHIKISWGRNHKHTAFMFRVKGDKARPFAEGFCMAMMNDKNHTDAMFVNPSPASSRCSATWFNSMSIRGKIELNGQSAQDSNGLAAMIINRCYYKFRSRAKFCVGLGTIKGRDIIFHLKTSNMDAANADSYNENILTVDGQQTALPPVYITHPFGKSDTWIIQDTEGMVDLTFTPLSKDDRTINIIAIRRTSTTIYGTFEGTLLTKEGEKLSFKGVRGIMNSSKLRM